MNAPTVADDVALNVAVNAPKGRPGLALAASALCVALSTLGMGSANVGLPVLADAFGASFHDAQWIVLAYLLAMTSLIVGVGRLGDLYGKRRLLLAGTLLYAAASVLCAVAPSLWALVAARAGQGLGAAAMTALAMACVGAAVPREKTAAAMGLMGTASAVGTAAGPALGGLLLAGFGWRALFWSAAPLGVAAFAMVWRYLPADAPSHAENSGFDGIGAGLLAATLGFYAMATTGDVSLARLGFLALAGVGAALFFKRQTTAPTPLIRLATLRFSALGRGLVMSALVATVMMATLVAGPFHLAHALELAPAAAGAVMSAGPLTAALTGAPAGRLADRIGTGKATVVGLCAVTLGSLSLASAPAAWGVAGYLVPLMTTTAGYALFQTANNAAVMSAAGAAEKGAVSGLLNLSRNLGLITGASLLGAVYAAAGMGATFAAAACAALTALVLARRA